MDIGGGRWKGGGGGGGVVKGDLDDPAGNIYTLKKDAQVCYILSSTVYSCPATIH